MEETRLQKDQRSLSRIFPDVVWLIIYGQLVLYPNAVKNMFLASPFFRNLLYSRRNYLLFSTVLSTKLMKLFVFETKFHRRGTEPYSSNPLLLKLRLICRSWCTTVEKAMLQMYGKVGHRPIRASLEDEVDDEAQFLSHFKESHSQVSQNKSPFIGNTISFYVDWNNEEGIAVNWDMPLKHLLPKYGRYIRKCKLDFNCKAMPKQWFEAAVLHALLNMPNVQALELNLNPKDFVNSDDNPANLPDVPNLPELQVDSLVLSTNKTSDGIVSKLLFKMPNLRTLSVSFIGEITSSQNLFSTLNSSQLEHLDLTFKTAGRPFQPCHEYLRNHPLFQDHPCLLDAGLHASFRTLESHSPMNYLRTLRISVNCVLPSSWHEWEKYSINLPNLVEFTLSTWTWPCIDMVLLFRDSLKKLILHVQSAQTFEEWKNLDGAKKLMEREQIKFLSCNASFHKDNNIWTKVSKLDEVIMSIRITGHPMQTRVQRFNPSGVHLWENILIN